MTEKRFPASEIEGAEQAQNKDKKGLADRHAARVEAAEASVEEWRNRDKAAFKASVTPPPLRRQNR